MNAVTPAAPPFSPGGEEAARFDNAFMALVERVMRDPSFDIGRIDSLLKMREREHARISERLFNEALSRAQAEMEPIRVDSANNQTNSRYASYAALDGAIRAIYTSHGFGVTFDTEDARREQEVRVVCDVCHSGGYVRRYRLEMPADGTGPKGAAVMTRTHAVGSGITYGKRYLLGMIFNLAVCRDDDGNAAGRKQRQERQEQRQTPQRNAVERFEDTLAAEFPSPHQEYRGGRRGTAEYRRRETDRTIDARYEAVIRADQQPRKPYRRQCEAETVKADAAEFAEYRRAQEGVPVNQFKPSSFLQGRPPVNPIYDERNPPPVDSFPNRGGRR